MADTKVCLAPCLSLMARAPLGQLFTCFMSFRPYHASREESASCRASFYPQLCATSQELLGIPGTGLWG